RSSVGYTVIDPETGAGAYLIGGGENRGELLTALTYLIKTLSFYLIFKGLLRVIAGVAGSALAPVVGMLTGILAISQGCKNTTAAMLFNGILVALSLMLLVLGPLLIFGVLSFLLFTAVIFLIKMVTVKLMLNTPLCKDG